MKKVLIFSHAMELGGAERALSGLLHSLDYEQYQVDLFLMRHQGELMKYIPEGANLLPESLEYTCLAVPIVDVLKKGKLSIFFGRIKGKMKASKYVKHNQMQADNGVALDYSHKYTCKYMPQISDKEYDLAISFLTPHYFVAEKVKAKKKMAWIHTDYSYIDIDVDSELEMWQVYDYIASISDECTRGFCSKFPKLKEKIIRIDNIIPAEFVKQQAEVDDVTNVMPRDGNIRILSVGRFCSAKNFDNVPEICNCIVKAGLKIKWYLIGFGPDEDLIRKRILKLGMEENVIILGKKENPYPYMKECDWYVQPSRYEGNCVCVHEAQILGKPVIITNYSTAGSQLDDKKDGVIVPLNNKNCAEGIVEVIKNSEFRELLIKNVNQKDYSNREEVKKLYNLI